MGILFVQLLNDVYCYMLLLLLTLLLLLPLLLFREHSYSRLGWVAHRSPKVIPSRIASVRFLRTGCPSCHPTNSEWKNDSHWWQLEFNLYLLGDNPTHEPPSHSFSCVNTSIKHILLLLYYYKMYWLEWRCHSITVAGALNNEKRNSCHILAHATHPCKTGENNIVVPVNITALAELPPHSSMKWTASPKRNDGWPVNTTHGLLIIVLKPSAQAQHRVLDRSNRQTTHVATKINIKCR